MRRNSWQNDVAPAGKARQVEHASGIQQRWLQLAEPGMKGLHSKRQRIENGAYYQRLKGEGQRRAKQRLPSLPKRVIWRKRDKQVKAKYGRR